MQKTLRRFASCTRRQDIAFIVDANYALDTERAIVAANAFKPFHLVWFEEPIIPGD